MRTFTWEWESRQLGQVLARLSFRDATGRELPVAEGFSRWCGYAVGARERRQVCYFVGNGASASLASHFSSDLAKSAGVHTQVFSDPALLTAVANDCGYDDVFVEPLVRMGNPGDLLVAISSSGQSHNVLRAAEKARDMGLTVVTLSSMGDTNPLRALGDLNAYVPGVLYGHSETCHAAVLHYWMDLVADTVAGPAAPHSAALEAGASAPEQPLRFDRARLAVRPLSEREHDLTREAILPLASVTPSGEALHAVAARIVEARRDGAAVLLMAGAHLLRAGVQRYLIDLMERGYVSGVALNGGGLIHDYELALVGATTESVARYIRDGQFGLWRETGAINDIVSAAAAGRKGLGAAVGEVIATGAYPHRDISILAAGFRLGLPVTVHVGIGYDIVHEHPNCDGAAYGQTSYADFLTFASLVEQIEGGVVMNFGSAVMAPEVFLKALAMARNVAARENRTLARFTSLVTDLRDLPTGASTTPENTTPEYYYRPLKTMLVRAVGDGGASFYVKGHHRETFPALWTEINAAAPKD